MKEEGGGGGKEGGRVRGDGERRERGMEKKHREGERLV